VSVLALLGTALELGGMTSLNGQLYTADDVPMGGLIAVNAIDGGFGATSRAILENPDGLCTDGRSIYICEGSANDIRQYDPATGQLTLLAGQGTSTGVELDGLGADAGFKSPAGCAWDPGRGRLYVTDQLGNTLRLIE